jgi:hypothetical protein
MTRTKVALVGIGKIALDQHVPAINASPDWELAGRSAAAARSTAFPAFTDFATFRRTPRSRGRLPLHAPGPPLRLCRAALAGGPPRHAGKPPGATLAEVHALEALAAEKGLTLYATWHSRMAHAVAPAKAWLRDKTIRKAHITWREDVRKWHPGQDWVFEPGGMGVFDPGINALSILTEILPAPVHLTAADAGVPREPPDPHRRPADLLEQRHRRFRLASGGPADLGHQSRPTRPPLPSAWAATCWKSTANPWGAKTPSWANTPPSTPGWPTWSGPARRRGRPVPDGPCRRRPDPGAAGHGRGVRVLSVHGGQNEDNIYRSKAYAWSLTES